MTGEQVQAFITAHPDTVGEGGFFPPLVEAAELLGVPPGQFQAFVEQMAAERGEEVWDTMRRVHMLWTEAQPVASLGGSANPPDPAEVFRAFLDSNYPDTVGRYAAP